MPGKLRSSVHHELLEGEVTQPGIGRDLPSGELAQKCAHLFEVPQQVGSFSKSIKWFEGWKLHAEVMVDLVCQCGIDNRVAFESGQSIGQVLFSFQGHRNKKDRRFDPFSRVLSFLPMHQTEREMEGIDPLFIENRASVTPKPVELLLEGSNVLGRASLVVDRDVATSLPCLDCGAILFKFCDLDIPSDWNTEAEGLVAENQTLVQDFGGRQGKAQSRANAGIEVQELIPAAEVDKRFLPQVQHPLNPLDHSRVEMGNCPIGRLRRTVLVHAPPPEFRLLRNATARQGHAVIGRQGCLDTSNEGSETTPLD